MGNAFPGSSFESGAAMRAGLYADILSGAAAAPERTILSFAFKLKERRNVALGAI